VEGGKEFNEIERKFFEAYLDIEDADPCYCDLEPQKVIGIYKVDFAYGDCVIEIDGHEYHKTKEQRQHDYERERYLLRNGYVPIRFTGTEVFLEPERCVREMFEIVSVTELKRVCDFERGIKRSKEVVNEGRGLK
jgi:hypothetical protein